MQLLSIGSLRRSRSIQTNRPTPDSGFTLVELLVVLVILVMLASLVGPRVLGYIGSSKSKAAKVQIGSIASAIELYKLDAGRYPSTAEGLAALVKAPATATNWNGPYLTTITKFLSTPGATRRRFSKVVSYQLPGARLSSTERDTLRSATPN